MILSRVIKHVRHQHWTAVFLDFIVVVVGVFIGIQVSNWNAAREDALLGQDYVRRLTIDLNTDLAAARSEAAYYDQVLGAVEQTVKLLPDTDADPKALVESAYRATEIIYIAPTQATWNQIVSSGHLGLLPKGAAERALSGYYSFNTGGDAYKILGASAYRREVREIVPVKVQLAIRAGCSDERDGTGFAVAFMKTCALDVEPALLRSTAQALRNDPEVAKTLRYQYSDVYTATQNLRGTINLIEQALAALRQPPRADGGGPRQ